MAIDNAARGLALAAQTTATAAAAQSATVANAVTFDNSGSGAASGTTYNGSAAKTVSTNTIGALKASNNLSDVSSVYTAAKNLGIGYVVSSSNASVTHTGDTAAWVADTIALPAMGANDVLQIIVEFGKTGTAGAFTPTIKLGSTFVLNSGGTGATILYTRAFQRVVNKGATNVQQFGPVGSAVNAPFANSTVAVAAGAEETNAGINLIIGCTNASAADTVTRLNYQVILFPKA